MMCLQVLLADKLPGFAETAKSLHYVHYNQDVPKKTSHCKNNVMVFFLGGCTYSEAAALGVLGENLGVNIIVASTAFSGGAKLIGSIILNA